MKNLIPTILLAILSLSTFASEFAEIDIVVRETIEQDLNYQVAWDDIDFYRFADEAVDGCLLTVSTQAYLAAETFEYTLCVTRHDLYGYEAQILTKDIL